MADNDVYSSMQLHITPEKFYIEPTGTTSALVLSINRMTHEITLEDIQGQIPSIASSREIFGIVGIINLIAGPYLIVIAQRDCVGEINGQVVWSIGEVSIVPYSRSLLHLSQKQTFFNTAYLSMIKEMLSMPTFYFSYSYDVTHTLQRLYHTAPDFLQSSVLERADPRFVWNAHLLSPLSAFPEMNKFCLPIMMGFVSINHCSLNGKSFCWSVIARRSCQRAGTRLFMRGIDKDGNVANYVEVEQIVEHEGDRSSFVQTRGSIPLFWTQYPNLQYKPKPQISRRANHLEAFVKHFQYQLMYYGKQVIVNLINQTGSEGELERAYRNLVTSAAIPDVRYEAFDFHKECRNMQWDRLNILTDRLSPEMDEFGYFFMTRDAVVRSQQEGVFRTNCIDCLDRTNVTQSMLAHKNLETVLRKMSIISEKESVEEHHQVFEALFKNVWANHGDQCSAQYTGTGAMKADFTRTGKRNFLGVVRDGHVAIVRYMRNNFSDGSRQDGFEVFLGRHVASEAEGNSRPCPLDKEWAWIYFTALLVGLVAFGMWFATLFFASEYDSSTLLLLLFWGGLVVGAIMYVIKNGTEYVDNPKIAKLAGKDE